MGCIDMNAWYSRVDKPDRPDFVLFDLDPTPEVPWSADRRGALLLKGLLDGLGPASFPKTSGGKGFHVLVPLDRRSTYEDTRRFAERVAGVIAAALSGARDDRVVEGEAQGRADRRQPERLGKTIASADSRAAAHELLPTAPPRERRRPTASLPGVRHGDEVTPRCHCGSSSRAAFSWPSRRVAGRSRRPRPRRRRTHQGVLQASGRYRRRRRQATARSRRTSAARAATPGSDRSQRPTCGPDARGSPAPRHPPKSSRQRRAQRRGSQLPTSSSATREEASPRPSGAPKSPIRARWRRSRLSSCSVPVHRRGAAPYEDSRQGATFELAPVTCRPTRSARPRLDE